ncbi:MAG: hypothetical protein IT585_04455 [candidate division Zixibacteria bacterium]|nr:hypothetical protein [candidate division Zixibacteria bacterium]
MPRAIARSILARLALLLPLVAALSLQAAVPGLVSYQGRLTTAAGDPVPDATYFLRFQIYDAPTGGTSLWNSNIQPVVVTGGVYTYLLGQDVSLPDGIFNNGNRWLGITVGADPESTPRKQFLTSGFAFVSQNADSVNWGGIRNMPAGFADGIDNIGTGDITAVNTTGGLTGGVTSGDANIAIASGGITSSHIQNGTIVDADIANSANIAPGKIAGGIPTLTGTQTFSGANTFNSTVIFGDSTARIDNTTIALGRITAAPTALLSARRKYNDTFFNYGLYSWLENASTGQTTALYGLSRASTPGAGNGGLAQGVYARGESDGTPRYGVQAISRSLTPGLTTGGSWGVVSNAKWGSDVFGMYASGDSASFAAYGVMAKALNSGSGYGVHGAANNNATYGYGVWGEAYNNGWANYAGYFAGDVNVSGTIFTPAKVTQIDHPLDPENQTLRLAGIDAPDQKVIYDGIVTTDNNGEAVVVLPAYADALTTDFRYQLTVIGDFAQAIVIRKVEHGQFTIKTEKPNLEVSWQVAGLRKDAFARANPLVVESRKRPQERGAYLQPEAFGRARDQGIDAVRSHAPITPTTNDDLLPAELKP